MKSASFVKVINRIKADLIDYKLAILFFAIYYGLSKIIFRAFCPLVILTGIPCPACGMTRAIMCLFTGQFERAFALHPIAILWVLFIVWIIICRYILGRQTIGFYPLLLMIAVITIVFYGYRMITQFPGYSPMSYTPRNILEKILPFYKPMLRKWVGI